MLLDLPLGDLDYDALAVFIRLGYFVGDTTPFANIRYVGPEPWMTRPSGMPRSAAIDRYGELFRAAVRKRIAEAIVLPLSGGRDSRHILFELLEAGEKPTTVTLHGWVPRGDDDVRIARELARRCGLGHAVIGSRWPSVRAEFEMHELTDFCSDEGAWALPIREFILARRGIAFDGVAGDILSAGLYLHPGLLAAMREGNAERAADMLLGQEAFLASVLEPGLYRKLSRERAATLLQAEIAKHFDAPNPVSSYLFWNRTRREIAHSGSRILGAAEAPYIDDAVYDHLTSLPADYFLDRTFHTETIDRMFPQYRDIPYDNNSSSTRPDRWLFRLASLKAELYRLVSGSRWVVRRFLGLRTTPADVARVLYLLHLEGVATCSTVPLSPAERQTDSSADGRTKAPALTGRSCRSRSGSNERSAFPAR